MPSWSMVQALEVMLLLAKAAPSSGNMCSVLATRRVYFPADVSCYGQTTSSCSTVVSFDLPRGLHDHQLTSKIISLEAVSSLAGDYGLGLTVVHGQALFESSDTKQEHYTGLFYSIDTRVVEVGSASTELQVKILYSDDIEENSNSTPGWPGSPGGMQLYRGGSDLTLDVVYCAQDHPATVRQQLAPPRMASPKRSHPAQRHGLGWENAFPGTPMTAVQRRRLMGVLSTKQEPVEAERDTGAPKEAVLLRGGSQEIEREGGDIGSAQKKMGVLTETGDDACDSYNGGNAWCAASLSDAETRTLEVQGTKIYCSRQCDDGGLWCNIFGKPHCRKCSDNCDGDFCVGNDDCNCHPCPATGATETWECVAGGESSCYDQITSEDLGALALNGKRLVCTSECLEDGGLWCSAMGVNGCGFCAVSCADYCAGEYLPEDCDCVECPDGLELPYSDDAIEDEEEEAEHSCADEEDGDDYCLGQVSEEGLTALGIHGMGIECHVDCLPGVPWPVWCFAEDTVGCRYCMEDCEANCGEGVTECDTCYTCEEAQPV